MFRNFKDDEVPKLEDEMKKFTGRVSSRIQGSSQPGYSFFSCFTAYGLQRIYDGLLERIYCDDRPVTLLWHHQGGYSHGHGFTPVKQENGEKPVNGQKGGYYYGYHRREDEKPRRMQGYYKWVSFGRKTGFVDGKKKAINLEDGEPLENIEKKYNWATSDGYWLALPHYMPCGEEINCYPGDVKKAILSSPLSDDMKQELLGHLYESQCPNRKIDRKYCKITREICSDMRNYYENDTDDQEMKEIIENRIEILVSSLNDSSVPSFIRDNLVLNLNNYKKDYAF